MKKGKRKATKKLKKDKKRQIKSLIKIKKRQTKVKKILKIDKFNLNVF